MLKELVEDIIKYTKNYSISESEWYWNIEGVRKSDDCSKERITWEEFEMAIRQEILYDLVYHNGYGLCEQMENDLCNYTSNDIDFQNASQELEEKVQGYLDDFKLERYD